MGSVGVRSFEFGRDESSILTYLLVSCVCNVFPSFEPTVKYLGVSSNPINFEICDLNCLSAGCDRMDCGSLFNLWVVSVMNDFWNRVGLLSGNVIVVEFLRVLLVSVCRIRGRESLM